MLAAPEDLSQALEVKAAHVEAIIKQARQMFDYVVLDVGRSIDAVSLQALDLATHVFPVLQLSLPQIRDAQAPARAVPLARLSAAEDPLGRQPLTRRTASSTLESLEQTLGVEGPHDDPEPLQAA